MNYRPEIDGLRALAVLPVILFHAGFAGFSGGFVGVDIFFVISGYLITSIIYADLVNKRFSLNRFYERRARRILPALYLVTFCCLPVAWLTLGPIQMKEFCESLIGVATFSSNFTFKDQSDYFRAASELKPLLHTWSLAAEEQFYLLFPLLLLLVKRLDLTHKAPLSIQRPVHRLRRRLREASTSESLEVRQKNFVIWHTPCLLT